MDFIEWGSSGFHPAKIVPDARLPNLAGQTWWHAASGLGRIAAQGVAGVTHLADRAAAQHRADVQELNASEPSTVLHEIALPPSLSVLPDVYIENFGQQQMQAFEQKLLASKHDVAFTWNTKEANGAWAIIIRRSRLGEIPDAPGADVQVASSQKWKPGDYYSEMKPMMGRRPQ